MDIRFTSLAFLLIASFLFLPAGTAAITCPASISINYSKLVYFNGEGFNMSVMLYNTNGAPIPYAQFNVVPRIWYPDNGTEVFGPTETRVTDQAGVYRASGTVSIKSNVFIRYDVSSVACSNVTGALAMNNAQPGKASRN